MQEAKLPELPCAAKRADVEWTESSLGDALCDRPVRVLVVACDQDVELLSADLARDERRSKRGVERFHDGSSLREELGHLLGGGRPGRCDEVVPRLGVDWVGDVDDDLPLEPVAVLA